jgi:hypothetical protein
MGSNMLKQFEKFCRRHLRLSSFLYLLLQYVIFRFYIAFDSIRAKDAGVGAFIEMVFHGLSLVSGDTALASIPIFLISLLLYTFLKQKSVVKADWSFFRKFILAFFPFPTFIGMVLICLAPPPQLIMAGILYGFIFSFFSAFFFALLSEVSKTQFVLQCIIVMPVINLLMTVTVIFVDADITLV